VDIVWGSNNETEIEKDWKNGMLEYWNNAKAACRGDRPDQLPGMDQAKGHHNG